MTEPQRTLRTNPSGGNYLRNLTARVQRDEALEAAMTREVREETGLMCTIIRQVGVINQIFPECHTIATYYVTEAETATVQLNAEHSAYQWVARLPPDSHPFLKAMIEAASLPT